MALKFINGMTGKKSPLRGKFRGLITAIYNRHCVHSNLDFTLRRVGGGSEIEMTENASAFGKTVQNGKASCYVSCGVQGQR